MGSTSSWWTRLKQNRLILALPIGTVLINSAHGPDLDYCIRLRTPALTQRRAKRLSIATAQQGGTRGGAFVGEHGRWDRPRFNGYKVVFVPFSGGRPSGKEDVVTGFLNSDEKARGRPVGLAVDESGADCR